MSEVLPPSREPYDLANGMAVGENILLHVCCAPCSCEIIEGMLATDLKPTLYFYNPNVHPQEEYDIRKNEVIRFAAARGVAFVDADYDTDNWFARVKGLEHEPERGRRCSACFALRMHRTALYAHEHNFRFFATSLSISRHKNQEQVHQAGEEAARSFKDVQFWAYNWRQKGGSDRGARLAKAEGFYRQNYCGCIFSKRSREGTK